MNALLKKIGEWPYKISHLWAVGLLSLLTLGLFLPTLHYGFVFDDYPTLLEYPHMHTSAIFFSSCRWISRALQRIGVLIGGLEPVGFRVVNMFVHLAIGLLIYALFITIFQQLKQPWFRARARLLAFLAALLFLIHPAQTQTATYMTQMSTEGVAALVIVLVTLLFVRGIVAIKIGSKIAWYAASFIAAYVGCGSKEIIVVLPGLVLLTDFVLFAQIDLKQFLKRIPLHLLLGAVMFVGLERIGVHVRRIVREAPKVELPNNRGTLITEKPREAIKPNLYRWSQPKILFHYLSIFFCPIGLCFEYGTKLVKSSVAPDVLVPLLFFICLVSGAAVLAMRRLLLPGVFGIAWFLMVMLPRSIAPSQELVCDYKTYIASIGIMMILAPLLVYVIEYVGLCVRASLRQKVVLGGVASFVMVLMASAHVRNLVWKDELTFWSDVIAKVPDRARAHNNLAIAYLLKNDIEMALALFNKSVELDPLYGEPHVNLAHVYERLGERTKAAREYELALVSGEMHPQLFYNLGLFNKNSGAVDLAEKSFRKAIEIRPFYPTARYELAQILYDKKQLAQVIVLCEETIALHATAGLPFDQIYGLALFAAGDTKRALPALLACDTTDPEIAFAAGCCFFDVKDYKAAVQHFEIAHKNNRHDVSIAYNFGQALLEAGQYDYALDVFGRCNNVVDKMPLVPLFKAKCLQKMGRSAETKVLLTQLIKTSGHEEVRRSAQDFLKTI